VASLNRVVVYRTINGQRMGALFNVSAIRNGTAKDPDIFGNDVVIVGYSEAKSIWRDILSTSPLLNVFRPLGY
jgi:polysaccharide export outer membrane protein